MRKERQGEEKNEAHWDVAMDCCNSFPSFSFANKIVQNDKMLKMRNCNKKTHTFLYLQTRNHRNELLTCYSAERERGHIRNKSPHPFELVFWCIV